jgi:hypothetical protein
MNDVVEFPDTPEWARVDGTMRDRLIGDGYLKYDSRHDWRAVLMAANDAFHDACLLGLLAASIRSGDAPTLASLIFEELEKRSVSGGPRLPQNAK